MTSVATTSTLQLQPNLSPSAQIVRDALAAKGLETPMIDNGLNRDQKYQAIKAAMRDVVTTLGLDLSDDSLQETPHRIAKMYVDEVFSGLDYSNFPKNIGDREQNGR